jgi:RNA polymerase sigma factor (sigma-70 family)
MEKLIQANDDSANLVAEDLTERVDPETARSLVEFAWSVKDELVRFAYSKVWPYGLEAEDIVQDVFAKILKRNYSYTESNPKAWLLTMTHNLCIDRIRTLHTIPMAEVRDKENPDFNEQPFTGSGLSSTTKSIIESLPHEQKQIIFLLFMAELSVAQVVDAHGLQYRGRTALKQAFRQAGMAPSAKPIKTPNQKRWDEIKEERLQEAA